MKAEIYRNYPKLETADDTEETLLLLLKAAKEAWHSIEQSILDNISENMSNKVEFVLKAEG